MSSRPSAQRSPEPDEEQGFSDDEFARQVHRALSHLHNPAYLQTLPLESIATLAKPNGTSSRGPSLGRALGQSLVDAIDSLQPDPKAPSQGRGSRYHDLLHARYVEALDIDSVCDHLGIGRREYFRSHRRALVAVSSVLKAIWRLRADRGPGPEISQRLQLVPFPSVEDRAASVAPRSNLPIPISSFVGREREIAEVRRLVGESRLATLTGTGGCGKSRLAYRVATELLEEFPDGTFAVELASLSDPTLVPQTVASSLGLREESGRPILDTLVDQLRPKRLLLVLDNCEHLLDACAQLTTSLLQVCSQLQILATSREPLGITGEVAWRVPSLTTPPPDSLAHDPAKLSSALSEYDAARLFLERARAARSDFTLSERNAQAIAELCSRLDGIPLAIELAATRVSGLAVEEIVARLDQRFQLLTSGSRTALPRQQTLRATIDWSYELLDEAERVLFRRLAVFAGGCTLEAVEGVCAGERFGQLEHSDALELLLRLVGKSLVVAEQEEEGTRYHLLETIRQFAREKLVESEEAEAVQEEHAAFYFRLTLRANEQWLKGPRRREGVDRLESERDNLRGALQWLEQTGDVERGLLMALTLRVLWEQRGPFSELEARLEALLRLPGSRETHKGVEALADLAYYTSITHGREAARPIAEESVRLGRALGHPFALAYALLYTAGIVESDSAACERHLLEAHQLFQALDMRGLAATCLCRLAGLDERSGDLRAARAHFEEGLRLLRGYFHPRMPGMVLSGFAWLCCRQGDLTRAWELAEESLWYLEESDDRPKIAWTRVCQAAVLRLRGDLERATELAEEALMLGQEAGDRPLIADAEAELAMIAIDQGDLDLARSHLEASCGQVLEGESLLRDVVPLLAQIARGEADSSHARTQLEERLKTARLAWETSGWPH